MGGRERKRKYLAVVSCLTLHINCDLIRKQTYAFLTYNPHFTGEEIETQRP